MLKLLLMFLLMLMIRQPTVSLLSSTSDLIGLMRVSLFLSPSFPIHFPFFIFNRESSPCSIDLDKDDVITIKRNDEPPIRTSANDYYCFNYSPPSPQKSFSSLTALIISLLVAYLNILSDWLTMPIPSNSQRRCHACRFIVPQTLFIIWLTDTHTERSNGWAQPRSVVLSR